MLFQTWFDPAYARKNFLPLSNETLALGSSSFRWSNVYSKVFNVSDGTRLGVLQANSNGIEIGSTSNDHLRFLVNNTLVASFRITSSEPDFRFQGSPIIGTVDNARVITFGVGTGPTYSTGAYVQFIGNSYGSGNGNLQLNSGNASGGSILNGVWSTNGYFGVFVNGANDLAMKVLSTKNLELYGITDYKATMGDSTKVVGTNAPVDWVEVMINGTTRYLPAYAA